MIRSAMMMINIDAMCSWCSFCVDAATPFGTNGYKCQNMSSVESMPYKSFTSQHFEGCQPPAPNKTGKRVHALSSMLISNVYVSI